jgi:glycyl-tRNA synthetase beta chain
MSTQDLLIEIGTEELPPKALLRLSETFLASICEGLDKQNLNYIIANPFATPRRLAVMVKGLVSKQADNIQQRKGPAVNAAFDKNGKPSQAALGFAHSCGVDVTDLDTLKTDKGEWLVFNQQQQGQATADLIPNIVRNALATLPIPKRMRWGDSDFEFVRPVHWVVLLFGEKVISANILGVDADNKTYGHRFHAPQAIELKNADDYVKLLERQGKVLPVFSLRRAKIKLLIEEAAELNNACAVIDENLLDEVTALVEWPVCVVGHFDADFLRVPSEALVSVMKGHQKYFHMVDADNGLLPQFITLSNIDSLQPDTVRQGNERVIRPRLNDAAFFWQQDQKMRLDERLEKTKTVVFQSQLGTLYDKAQRISRLSQYIAAQLGTSEQHAARAGLLSKSDLISEMVGEFPELQGIIGEYCALNDGEHPAVALAIKQHYQPRFGGDDLPDSPTGQVVALAERLDNLVGIFGIGQAPTGDKDPFALRRAAIGVLRILVEGQHFLALDALLQQAYAQYPDKVLASDTVAQVFDFMQERLHYYLLDNGAPLDTLEAVLSCGFVQPLDCVLRIQSVEEFRLLPAAATAAAANKRIHNVLKKASKPLSQTVKTRLLQQREEQVLYAKLLEISELVEPLLQQNQYSAALQQLAQLGEAVDGFFDKVMVMAEQNDIRQNRLALLQQLRALFLQVADISCLQTV